MDSERRRQIEDLYNAALAREPAERSSLLDQADPEVRREVALLLAQAGYCSIVRPGKVRRP